MAFNRLERIKEEYKREMASVIRTVKDPRMYEFTSVVAVDVTKDLKYAKVYISVMGDDTQKKDTLEALKSATGYIKKEVGSKLNLRLVPHPTFVIDTSIEYGMHINDLIHKINNGEK